MIKKFLILALIIILGVSGAGHMPIAHAEGIPENETLTAKPGAIINPEPPVLVFLPLIRNGNLPPDPWAGVTPAQNIVWWHPQTGTSRLAAIQSIVDGFNASNGYGITVTAEYAGGYSDIFNQMMVLLNTPNVPDLVTGYQTQTATYQLLNAMFDMNELINHPIYGLSPADQADFFPGVFTQDVYSVFNDARLGLSNNRSLEVLYYNQSWLTQLGYTSPPTTPEQFRAMACAATAEPYDHATSPGSMGYQLSIDASRFASWTFAFGGDIFDKSTSQYTLNSPAAISAMEFLQDLFSSGCAQIVTSGYGDQLAFGNGTLLFAIGPSSGIPYYQGAVNSGAKHEWTVGALPSTTATPRQNVYGASISIPKSTPERELSAWLFLKYLTDTDSQVTWTLASSYHPTRASTSTGLAGYFVANPHFKNAFDLLPYGMAEPSVPGYDFVRNEIVNTLAALVLDTGLDVQTKLNELNVVANQILAEQLALMNP